MVSRIDLMEFGDAFSASPIYNKQNGDNNMCTSILTKYFNQLPHYQRRLGWNAPPSIIYYKQIKWGMYGDSICYCDYQP